MINLLRFLEGLFSAALQWLAGLICMSPVVFLLAFDESGRLARDPSMLLVGFLVLGCFAVWLAGFFMRQLAPRLTELEPFGYGQTIVGATLCCWSVIESSRAAAIGHTSIYPLFALFVPGLMLLLYGLRSLMMSYFAGE